MLQFSSSGRYTGTSLFSSGHSPTGIEVARVMRREVRMRERMWVLEGIVVVVAVVVAAVVVAAVVVLVGFCCD